MFRKLAPRVGISLVLTTVFVSAFLLVMAGMLEVQMRVHKLKLARENRHRAEDLAESAENTARWVAQQLGIGGNTEDLDEQTRVNNQQLLIDSAARLGLTANYCADVDGQGANGFQPCVEFSVKGRPAVTDTVAPNGVSYLSVPMRGTGSAGNTKKAWYETNACDTLPLEQLQDADNSCNWNRISVGKSIEIPLYYKNAQGQIVKPDFRNSAFKLRVRSPCRPEPVEGHPEINTHVYPKECDVNGRVVLFPRANRNPGHNDPFTKRDKDRILLNWLITDSQSAKILIPLDNDVGDSNTRPSPTDDIKAGINGDEGNTELSAGRINAAADFAGNAFALHNFLFSAEAFF